MTQTPLDPDSPPTPETPSSERTPAASFKAKKPNAFGRAVQRVAGPNTRFSKGLVSALRIFALAALAFFLGMLLVALQWYRPTLAQLDAARKEMAAQTNSLQQSQEKLRKAEINAFNAQELADKAQTRLGTDQARLQLMQVRLDLADVRSLLAQKNPGEAKKAIIKARTDIRDLLTQYKQADEKQVSNINAVFTLLENDLENFTVAQQDLARMNSELDALDQKLQSDPPDFWTCSCTVK